MSCFSYFDTFYMTIIPYICYISQQIMTVSGQSLFWAQNNGRLANIYLVFAAKFANVHATQFFINNPENSGRINSNTNSAMKWYLR